MLENKWNTKFKFKEGHYFRANACGDRPVGKVLRFEHHPHEPKGSWLVIYTWGRGQPGWSSYGPCSWRYKEMQQAYSVSGPIEEVCKLEGLVRVGE